MRNEHFKYINFYLPKKLYEDFEELKNKKILNRSELVRICIMNFLHDQGYNYPKYPAEMGGKRDSQLELFDTEEIEKTEETAVEDNVDIKKEIEIMKMQIQILTEQLTKKVNND